MMVKHLNNIILPIMYWIIKWKENHKQRTITVNAEELAPPPKDNFLNLRNTLEDHVKID